MKTFFITSIRMLGCGALAALSILAIASSANAKDKDDNNHGHSRNYNSHRSDHDNHDYEHDDHARRLFSSHPRSGFTLSLGYGYAGRGYYYGPPNSSYYYQRPDVHYYATRETAPREYYSRVNSTEVAVQRALARAGYYQGSIDGEIGPQSRRAIARFQENHRLRPTGIISQSLLNALGLQ